MKMAVFTSGIQWTPNGRPKPNELISTKNWKTIIHDEAGLEYDLQTADVKEKWCRYFLYGMAAHTATDAWAHSSCYKDSTGYHIIKHPDADNTEKKKNRIKCASDTEYLVAVNSKLKILGEIIDFEFYGESYWTGFYMANILKYVQASDSENLGTAYLTKRFKDINCSY